jgi:nitroreductase
MIDTPAASSTLCSERDAVRPITPAQRRTENRMTKLKYMLKTLIGTKRIVWVRGHLRRWTTNWALRRSFRYDIRRYAESSTALRQPYDSQSLAARIMMDVHRTEKGMALPSPRMRFGRDPLRRLISMVPEYERRFGPALETNAARKALREYADFHRFAGVPISPELTAFLATGGPEDGGKGEPAGTIEVTRQELAKAQAIDFDAFARNRFSIRNFLAKPVELQLVQQAVRTAMKTPSVCNRQSARVRVALDRDRIREGLSYQNGNSGFGETVGALCIVTSDMRHFVSVGERNQCWVDGGLFAMSLCYALHGLGLGSCMLNWSVTCDQDQKMRRALGIPDHEAVITMMAVGHIPEILRVAASPRRPLSQVLEVIH